MEEIFEYVEQHHDTYLEELSAFLRYKSTSTRDEGVKEYAELLVGIMEKSRIRAPIYPTDRHPTVYGERIENETLLTMLVYGHHGAQPPEPLGEWESEPSEPTTRGGGIFCRRVSDDKSQLSIHVKAVRAWAEVRERLPVNIRYLFGGEEGIGSPDLLPFVESHKELLRCGVCFYSDSHYYKSGRPQISLGVEGLCYVEIILGEAETDLHSMMVACIQNPVQRMVKLLNTMRDAEGDITIDGFYDDVWPLNQLEIDAVSETPSDNEVLKKQYGADHLIEGRKPDSFYYNPIFELICNIAGISSGFTGNGSKTVLSRGAVVKIDMRFVPGQAPGGIYETLRRHLDNRGFKDTQPKHYGMATPSGAPVDRPYMEVAAQTLREGSHEGPAILPGIGGVAPDFVLTKHLSAPSTAIPYATADQKNHTPNESMVLGGFFKGIRTSAVLPYYLAEKIQARA